MASVEWIVDVLLWTGFGVISVLSWGMLMLLGFWIVDAWNSDGYGGGARLGRGRGTYQWLAARALAIHGAVYGVGWYFVSGVVALGAPMELLWMVPVWFGLLMIPAAVGRNLDRGVLTLRDRESGAR